MKKQEVFSIKFIRLPKVDDTPGLVTLAIDGSDGVGPARRLGALTDVAGAPDGARVAVWTAGSVVQAAYAAPGAAFGPPEDVSAGGEADAARAAFPRAGAQPVAVWRTHRAAGTNVQEAARTG